MMNTLTIKKANPIISKAKINKSAIKDMMLNLDCNYKEAKKALKQNAEYEKLLIKLLPGNLDFLKNDYYKYADVTDDFIHGEALKMTEEQAYMFVYEWEQF